MHDLRKVASCTMSRAAVGRRSSLGAGATAVFLACGAIAPACGGSGEVAEVRDAGNGSMSAVGSDATLGGDAADDRADFADVIAPNDGPAVLRGVVQKGPFVLGSTVTLSAIDTSGTPTGQVFTTQTTTDIGDFNITFAYRGNVDIEAQGFYYDEVTGALSGAPVVLRALYDITNGGAQGAYVNVVTHLAHDRALNLMGDGGLGLSSAESQAEAELVAALGIGGYQFQPGAPGIGLNEVGGNTDANAYVFAISAVLVKAASQAADAGAVDAQLQELLDTIASDLAKDGQVAPNLVAEVRTAEQALDVDLAMDLLTSRLQAIGSNAIPADLNRAIDTDGDGYRNSVDTCPLVANPDQAQIPTGVVCKVTRHTTFLASGEPSDGEKFCSVLGDFENTSHLAVLGCGLGGAQASAGLAIGDGTGRFFAPLPVQLDTSDASAGVFVPVAVVDVNKDGNLDLVNEGGWAAGDGKGHFAPPILFPDSLQFQSATGALSHRLALADFNGDGLVDLAQLFVLPRRVVERGSRRLCDGDPRPARCRASRGDTVRRAGRVRAGRR
jgi:hypothetical protein